MKGDSLSIESLVSDLGIETIDQLVMLIDQQAGQLSDFQLYWDFLGLEVFLELRHQCFRWCALFGTELLPEFNTGLFSIRHFGKKLLPKCDLIKNFFQEYAVENICWMVAIVFSWPYIKPMQLYYQIHLKPEE